ncbi:hypothetical protein LSCM1_08076 [Leishmania martiniquensis]|uniref:GPR1/FUN34/yaaH family n=1 Tax=Leishmania martiniquensis TaxID=1580590 RepID=A0A836HK50_9TRYP|nr:hypothetical protein LSCM1_08076 [Leishmania martiniquensis]
MPEKIGVFAEGSETAAHEPTRLAATGVAADGKGTEGTRRRRRHPRKVVVYYFDSGAEDDEEAAGTSGKESGGPLMQELEELSHHTRSSSQGEVHRCSRCNPHRALKHRPVSPENPRIGSPTPISLFAFGMTTLLYNVHNAKICPLNMMTMGLVIMFGGLTQFVCGFLELINMNTLGCTISTTYGAFWMATAVLFLWPENAYVTVSGNNYTGGLFLLFFAFASALFASSFRSPFLCMALFLLVPLNFLLQSIGFFADSDAIARVAGYEGMMVGSLAVYLGMAFTLRDVYGRSLLPILFQKDMRYVEW